MLWLLLFYNNISLIYERISFWSYSHVKIYVLNFACYLIFTYFHFTIDISLLYNNEKYF